MLIRRTLLYLPAQISAPLLQFVAVVAWTHWMGAAEYGVLALATAAQDLAYFIGLGWWTQAMLRYSGDAGDGDERARYLASETTVLIVASLTQAAIAFAAVALTDAPMTTGLALAVMAFTATRSLAAYLAERARAGGRIGLYAFSQLFGPALGLFLAWLALTLWRDTAEAALWAFALAQALGVAVAAARLGVGREVSGASRAVVGRALAFGGPLIVAGALTWVSTNGVRLIVERFGTLADVGLLSVGWGLGLRLASVVALVFAAAAFPLALEALRAGERARALDHLSLNGVLLAGLLAPTAVGLLLIARPLVELMVAAPYREATVAVLPAAVVAGAVRNWRAHFVDQSFLLFERTRALMAVTFAEAALASLGAGLGMAQSGVVGAAWGACAGMSLAALLAVAVAVALFDLDLRPVDLARIALATLGMAVLVSLAPLDPAPTAAAAAQPVATWIALSARVAVGALAYPALLLALHPGLRGWALRQLARRRRPAAERLAAGELLAERAPETEHRPMSVQPAALAASFTGVAPPSPQRAGLAVVDGQAINVAALPDAVRLCAQRAAQGLGFTLFTLNLDHLVKRRADAGFADAYRRATFVTADGWPVAWLARRQGAAAVERATGADLVDPLCAEAARLGLSVHFFGASDETLKKAAAILTARHPGLVIAGLEAPPMGFDPASRAAEEAADRIAASGARLCFVAFGAPKQEVFSDRMARRHSGVGFVCIGAALDFIAGEKRRAPAFFQRTGLEWAWRLLSEPRRMTGRYARCAAVFADVAVRTPRRTPESTRAS